MSARKKPLLTVEAARWIKAANGSLNQALATPANCAYWVLEAKRQIDGAFACIAARGLRNKYHRQQKGEKL